MSPEARKIVAAVGDLFFSVQIGEAAKRAGLAVEFVRDQDALVAAAGPQTALIIIDLNHATVKPLQSISRLKADAQLRNIALLGFVSHVQGELKQKAQELGCDVVLPRSAFTQNLPALLKTYAGLR